MTVKSATGKAMMVTISRSARVADLKAKCVDALLPGQYVAANDKQAKRVHREECATHSIMECGAPHRDVSKAILLYAASKCDDNMTLDQVGLEGESCVHLVMPVVMTPGASWLCVLLIRPSGKLLTPAHPLRPLQLQSRR